MMPSLKANATALTPNAIPPKKIPSIRSEVQKICFLKPQGTIPDSDRQTSDNPEMIWR